MDNLEQTPRITLLKEKMLNEPRYVSIEQARIITRIYQENESLSIPKKRALSLKAALEELEIGVEKEELIVGNRTKGVRYGVVFPESGCSWVNKEFETLPTRPQDKFRIKKEDVKEFKEIIYPYWQDHSLEDVIKENYGEEINAIAKVVKINQKDHAQGHICPDTKTWLELGPKGLMTKAYEKLKNCDENQKEFYECTIIVLEGVCHFMMRYHDYILTMLESLEDDNKKSLQRVADICANLASRPAQSFHEALQSLWFLFVVLHMESNASSFSPGRMDQYLYPYYQKDIEKGIISKQEALEILECLWLKFNQIVYLRNQHSAKYFAGFPIGFNIAIGGIDENGCDIYNELSLLLLKAQYHLGLPQPNLSVRLNKNSSHELIQEAIKVVAKGSGMPQFFNDEAIVNSMIKDLGIEEKEVLNVIEAYSNALSLLDDYDHGCISKPKGKDSIYQLTYEECRTLIDSMKYGGFSDVFGVEKEPGKLNGIIAAVYQNVFGQEIYPSIEEKAANLLYFLVKDHPFVDGCKRIGASIFLEFLNKNQHLIIDGKQIISDSALVAITLMIAESRPEEKETMVKLVMNFLKA